MSDSEDSNAGIVVIVILLLGVAGAVIFFATRSADAFAEGQVTLNGVPLDRAMIVYVGAEDNKQPPVVALSDKEGNYKLVGNTGAGVPTGKYNVTVVKMALKDGTVPEGEKLKLAMQQELLRNYLPTVYEDQATTPFKPTLTAGKNIVNLEIKRNP